MTRFATLCLLALLGLLFLAACSGPSASREAEVKDLRERVERLERESAQDREQLAADIGALRAALDEANRHLAALSGLDPDMAQKSSPPHKSPRAALRESLRGVMDMSRQALDRLNQGLDKSLHRTSGPEPPAEPEK